ncbi:deoxyribose-phosphate aldolase [Leptolinea tardivitalis]|uniref:Deoxyribose-phosphate aldolase n=1 Tax=Leptolinea tardivitalis TaxID=229920 RepID=A0A0P6XUP9_9CHLR|nr:deoxyribose-phosphate aldolase [Leptolinea tardivitalis]KPL73155.1 deoxyribose-phosphate aldolase [Leptolinea tardivitalis]GAP21253.1 deoxyribose-phosphate aldolase [Leptolinea tardivitalis]
MTALNSKTITLKQLAKTIDHSLLTPDLNEEDVKAGCELAARYQVASVCVKPWDVRLAAGVLAGTDVKVGTVIGFPHGSSTMETKVFEARKAIEDGAVELDMVINIGAMRSGQYDYVRKEIHEVVEAARGKALVKVILENAYLTKEEIARGSQLVEEAGADFVKTSTGFAPTGATIDDLKLMRESVSEKVKIKAAHGIRTLDSLLEVIDAGATRVGARSTAAMLDEFAARYPDRLG